MSFIRLLEHRNRRERITPNGTEIVSTFYVEPYSAAPIVISALLGRVTGNERTSTRILPAADHDLPYCYCVDAQRIPLDARAISNGPSMAKAGNLDELVELQAALTKPAMYDGPQALNVAGDYERPDNKRELAGAFVEAVYRPLMTSFNYKNGSASRAFDFIDPQLFPASRIIPGAQSLIAVGNSGLGFGMSVGGEPTITETWHDFTIRRTMCPRVPWNTIRILQNKINGREWVPLDFTIPGISSFPAETLRFDSATVTERIIPTVYTTDAGNIAVDPATNTPIFKPMKWYDIVYHFSWRSTWDIWFDSSYNPHQGWVTWNCDWIPGKWSITMDVLNTGLRGFLLGQELWKNFHAYPTGWYEMGCWTYYAEQGETIFSTTFRKKYLSTNDTAVSRAFSKLGYNSLEFDTLFQLDAP